MACSAEKEQSSIALPVTAMVAAALVASSMCPDEALAARSGGRVGGGGFRSSASRAAPRTAATSSSTTTTVSNINVYSAPPVVVAPSMGYGYGGFSFMPTFPIFMPFGGGLFQVFLLFMILGVVFNVIKGMADAAGDMKQGKKDDWGDL
jgi:uncharacterized membrane protein